MYARTCNGCGDFIRIQYTPTGFFYAHPDAPTGFAACSNGCTDDEW